MRVEHEEVFQLSTNNQTLFNADEKVPVSLMARVKTADFYGLKIAVADRRTLTQLLCDWALGGQKRTAIGVNPQYINEATRNNIFRGVLEGADLLYADGIGILLMMKMLGLPLPERATTTDLLPLICDQAVKRGLRLYLLGNREGVTKEAALRLCRQYPGLQVVSTMHGYFSPEEEPRVIYDINYHQPHILFVGMGIPKEQFWVWRTRSKIDAPLVMTCGGMFDLVSGSLRRAPAIWQRYGFEWLYRLFEEPERLWKRYVIGNPLFVYRVVLHWLKESLGQRRIK